MVHRFAFALGLALALHASRAGAVEREHQLGADLGAALLAVPGANAQVGGSVGVNYTYGINDQFNFLAEGGVADFFGAKTSAPGRLGRIGIGAAYVLDVARLVPYGGLLLEAVVLDGGSLKSALPLPSLGVEIGVDYRIDRRFNVGVAAREHMLFHETAFLRGVTSYGSDTELFLRGAWVFGW